MHLAPSAKSTSRSPSFRFPDLTSDSANQLLAYALGASIVLHGVLLAVRFSPFDLSKVQDSAPALEIALVNAKSKSKPTKADILAQANLDGGGNTDAQRRAKTPLPALQKAGITGEVAVATQRIEALEIEAKELMTRINRSSGQKVLDAAAIRIVEMSAPFAAFPPDIKRDTDVLHITRTWTFTKGDELRSE